MNATTTLDSTIRTPRSIRACRELAYLLRAAVIDAQHVEKVNGYDRLSMATYFSQGGNHCYMCMGGARAILGMGAARTDPYDWSVKEQTIAECVDGMRKGWFNEASDSISYARYDGCVRLKDAGQLVKSAFDYVLQRAPWEVYMRAACILAGEGDPGPSEA